MNNILSDPKTSEGHSNALRYRLQVLETENVVDVSTDLFLRLTQKASKCSLVPPAARLRRGSKCSHRKRKLLLGKFGRVCGL